MPAVTEELIARIRRDVRIASLAGRLAGAIPAGRRLPAAYTSYRDKANGAQPSTWDVGGEGWTEVYTPDGFVTAMNVQSGFLTTNPTGGTTHGKGFNTFNAGAVINRIGCRFKIAPRTNPDGGLVIILANTAINPVSPDSALRFSCHLIVGIRYAELALVNASSGEWTTLGSWQYDTPILINDSTLYEVDVYRVGTTLTCVLPDGQVVSASHANVAAWAGNYGCVETIANNATTDGIVRIAEKWASTGDQTANLPTSVLARRDQVLGAVGETAIAKITTKPTIATAEASGDVAGLSIYVPYANRPRLVTAKLGILVATGDSIWKVQILNAANAIMDSTIVPINSALATASSITPLQVHLDSTDPDGTFRVRAFRISGSATATLNNDSQGNAGEAWIKAVVS